MTRLLPLTGLLKNLKQEIPEHDHRLYLTQAQAYETLKRLTGQDFGYRIDEWQAYLSSISFNLSNIDRPMAIQAIDALSIVKDIKRSGGTVIRGFRQKDALLDVMQRTVDEGRPCAVWPSMAALRLFYNKAGFVSTMRDVQSRLSGHRVLVEPDVYQSAWVFAIGPALDAGLGQESD